MGRLVLSGSLVPRGGVLDIRPDLGLFFVAKPHVVRYDDQGVRVGLSRGLHWFARGSRNPIDPACYCGPVELQVFDDGERAGRSALRFRLTQVSISYRHVSRGCEC